jgi:hypothetical protein
MSTSLSTHCSNHPAPSGRTDSGSVLLLTLLLLASMSLLMIGLASRIILTYRLHKEGTLGASETEQLWHGYAETLPTSVPARERCITSTLPTHTLCLWETPLLPTGDYPAIVSPERGFSRGSLPLWNVSDGLPQETTCFERIRPPESLSANGLRSLRSCTQIATIADSQQIDGNLLPSAEVLEIKADTVLILGNTLVQTLKVTPPLTLFAAGEIRIQDLEVVSGSTNDPVVLISATNKITVAAFSGPAVLSALSPIAVDIPSQAEASTRWRPRHFVAERIVEGSFKR